VIERER
jgi:hypothetical protein